jgi:hypothetical protein
MFSTSYFFSNGVYFMPITRRRRANPPEPPENNGNVPEQQENGAELFSPEPSAQIQAQDVESQAPSLPIQENPPAQPLNVPQVVQPAQDTQPDQTPAAATPPPVAPASVPPVGPPVAPPVVPPVAPTPSFHNVDNAYNPNIPHVAPSTPFRGPANPPFPSLQMPPFTHTTPYQNGEHFERPDRGERFDRPDRIEQRMDRQEYPPAIEGGRRTARGELFRRPPQPPVAQPMSPIPPAPALQAPTHEITLPLGNLLHLAYNPAYTGSDEARSALLHKLTQESKAGGRARCWSCGSLAIVYERWNTRSKTFGEVGIAFCEICGVWSVL